MLCQCRAADSRHLHHWKHIIFMYQNFPLTVHSFPKWIISQSQFSSYCINEVESFLRIETPANVCLSPHIVPKLACVADKIHHP